MRIKEITKIKSLVHRVRKEERKPIPEIMLHLRPPTLRHLHMIQRIPEQPVIHAQTEIRHTRPSLPTGDASAFCTRSNKSSPAARLSRTGIKISTQAAHPMMTLANNEEAIKAVVR
jgi:hypothetical protein